jgi:hypothetical protein
MLEKLFSILYAIQHSKVDEITIGELQAWSLLNDSYALILPNVDFIALRPADGELTISIWAFRSLLLGTVGAREVLSNGLTVTYKQGNATLSYQPTETGGFRITMTMWPDKVVFLRTV